MSIPYIFVFAVLAAIAFNLYLHISSRNNNPLKEASEFLEADRRSNFSRTKLIPDELYLDVDMSRLPLRQYPNEIAYMRVQSKQLDAETRAKHQMICLREPAGNAELKERYGIANWEHILDCEDSYNGFIHSLLEWASALVDMGNDHDAEAVLRLAIDYNCDRSQCFRMLADILDRRGDAFGLTGLKAFVQSPDTIKTNPSVKAKLVAYIEAIEQRPKHKE